MKGLIMMACLFFVLGGGKRSHRASPKKRSRKTPRAYA